MFDGIKAAERKLTHTDEDDEDDDEINCIEQFSIAEASVAVTASRSSTETHLSCGFIIIPMPRQSFFTNVCVCVSGL